MIVTVVLLVMAAACSLFRTDIQVPQSLSLRMDRPTGAPLQFAVLKDMDTAAEEVIKHADAMESFHINSITYMVKDFSGGNEPVIAGILEFALSGTTEFQTLATFEHLDLETMAASGAEVVLPVSDEAAVAKLAALMQRGSTITFRLNASTTNNPVAATLVLNFDTEMTVEL